MGAPRVTILILASGRGERFKASGGLMHKLDAHIHIGLQTKTVLQATLDKASSTGLAVHLERSNHAGMGDTIAAAVAATQDADGWLILPADMPMISPEVILAVANGLLKPSKPAVVAPFFQGERGHPVGFSRTCLSDLLMLRGDSGAKALLTKFGVKKINVSDLPLAAGCLVDIDTQQDLESVKNSGIFG